MASEDFALVLYDPHGNEVPASRADLLHIEALNTTDAAPYRRLGLGDGRYILVSDRPMFPSIVRVQVNDEQIVINQVSAGHRALQPLPGDRPSSLDEARFWEVTTHDPATVRENLQVFSGGRASSERIETVVAHKPVLLWDLLFPVAWFAAAAGLYEERIEIWELLLPPEEYRSLSAKFLALAETPQAGGHDEWLKSLTEEP